MNRSRVQLSSIVAYLLTVVTVAASLGGQPGQGVVTGTVIDAVTRTPIAGASVTINPGGMTAVTDGTGGYQAAVPVGTVSLTVSVPNRPFQSAFGVVVRNGATTTVNFAVSLPAATGILTGYVRNAATNLPIANATVGVSPSGNQTTTDANGRYEFYLPAGTYSVSASANSYVASPILGVVVKTLDATTVDFALSASTGTLTGYVRNVADMPIGIAQAIVSVSPGGNSTTTDANGRYELSLPTGTYTVSAAAGSYIDASARGIVVTNGGTTTVNFSLSASTGILTGYVRDAATDAPIGIANATVSVSPGGNSTATDANGRYELSLPTGTYTVSASADSYIDASTPGIVVTSGGTTTVNFALSRSAATGTLAGDVRSASTDAPIGIANATVSVSPGGNSTTTDANGRYELSLPVGTYTVGASAIFYGTTSVPGARVSGQTVTTQDLQLSSLQRGVVEVLHWFGGADGENPFSLILATDGDLYGLAARGGASSQGTIFKVTPSGTFTVLHEFTGGIDGAYPDGLIQAADGDFYGTTSGGASDLGTVFKMTTAGALTILHTFSPGVEGAFPSGEGVIQGTDGDFYGTTSYGGAFGHGSVFKMTASGIVTVLHEFSDTPDAWSPNSSLIKATDGNFYGTTYLGGTFGQGTVFKMTSAGDVTVLHSFTGPDGALPLVGLIQASNGDFYGTTGWGGAADCGTVFKMTPAGDVTVLHSFTFLGFPNRLMQATDGNVYGTTFGDYSSIDGTIFRMTPAGTVAILHLFREFPESGSSPGAGLVQGTDGNFYGTTVWGGGLGSVFRLRISSTAAALRTERVATSAKESPVTSSSKPRSLGASIGSADVSTQGTTAAGVFLPIALDTGTITGEPRDARANATVSTVATAAVSPGAQAEQGLVTGIVADAVTRAPIAGALVTISPSGLAAVTNGAGAYQAMVSAGTFSLTVSALNRPLQSAFGVIVKNGTTTTVNFVLAGSTARDPQLPPKRAVFELLHVFASTADGEDPGSLIQAADGYLYGTASGGGDMDQGMVFKMTPDGRFTVLHGFTGGIDGASPSRLIQAADGDFYGIASSGDPFYLGAVFKMSSAGDVTILHKFDAAIEGDGLSGLTQGTDGDFYGITGYGGPSDYGTAFKMTPDGIVTVLHVFSRGADGANPNPGLIQATDGNFYGTTYIGGGSDQGTVFKMTPDGTVTGLHAFTGGSDGAYPFVGLIQGFDGELYGTTYGGGSSNQGTAFKITRDGDVTILHSFFDVGSPSRLLQASDGYFYGTNFGDDIFGGGSIFRMTPAGAVTSLHSFDWIGSTGGSGPDGGLVQGADGAFYGTTVWGGIAGQTGHGTLFRLRFSSTAAAPVTESVPSPKDSPIAIGSNSLRGEARNLYATMAYGRRWTLRTTRQPAHTASQPSAHRGAWEIEAFAGTTFTSQPTGGTATLPPGGVPFVTTTGSPSRSVSSWYLGDGAALLNGVNTALAVSQQITPLDAALNTSLVERPSGGGGVRVSRIFTPRLTAEFTVEFSAVRGDLSNQASTSIEASRVSFLSAWQGLASAGQFSDTTMSSVRTGQLDNGHQIVATGAINVALKTAGKVIPYITVGAGVSSNSGTAASAGLVGDYRFSLGGVTPFHETDSVTVRYTAPDQTAVGVLGAGVKYQMSPHVGLRFDYRTYLGPNRDTTVLDGHPVVSTLTPAGSGASATTPGIQFSNDASIGIQSSLSGPKITDFRTFAGSGMQRHARLTFGLFWRF